MGNVYEIAAKPEGDLFRKTPGQVPCRNPARIPTMLQLIGAVWAIEGNTDLRLGQLLMSAARHGGWSSDDIWNCEEEVFAQGLLKMLKSDIDDLIEEAENEEG